MVAPNTSFTLMLQNSKYIGWCRLLSIKINTTKPMLATMMKMYMRRRKIKAAIEDFGVTFKPSRIRISAFKLWLSIFYCEYLVVGPSLSCKSCNINDKHDSSNAQSINNQQQFIQHQTTEAIIFVTFKSCIKITRLLNWSLSTSALLRKTF